MIQRDRRRVAAAAVLLVTAAAVTGQAASEEAVSVDDPRPVAAAVQQLMSRHDHLITYEDPRYLYSGDIKDVTPQVRKDLDRFPPGQAPKVLVPRGGRIRFEYALDDGTGEPADWGALLDSLLARYSADGGPRFRVEHGNGVDHVIPGEIRNSTGQWVQAASIVDARITIPQQQLTKAGIVAAVVKAIGEATNLHVGIGTCLTCGPHSLEPDPTQQFAVYDERARDVLWRVLQDWRPGTTWRIFQQPGSDSYVVNLAWPRPPDFVPAPAPPVLPSPPGTATPGCTPTPASARPCVP